MKTCTLNELCKKEVISCIDCSRLGYISDLNISLENARIVSVVVEQPYGFLKKTTVTIPWECISKIGDDLIIVDYLKPEQAPKPENRSSKFGFH